MRRIGAGLVLALLWLSRLPLGRWLPDPAPALASALWAFPLAGVVIGGLAALVFGLAVWAGLPPLIAALLAIGAQIWLTGGLHEDGLADFADGMGGPTPEVRLAIMRDSRIGSYGVLTLIVVIGLRVALLAALPLWQAVAALIAVAALSRSGIVAGLRLLPAARGDGLGKRAGRPAPKTLAITLIFGALPMVLLAGIGIWPAISVAAMLLACVVGQTLIGRQAQRALGGQTGDVLGAIQQAGECAALLALVATLA